MRTNVVQCDGCDKTHAVEKQDAMPLYWHIVSASTKNNDGALIRYDLCERCYGHWISAANPSQWPRTREATPQ